MGSLADSTGRARGASRSPAIGNRWDLFLWLGLGAWAMRSAGCVYNDIVDRDLDAEVERTRLRPLASGRVSIGSAWLLIAALCLIGFVSCAEPPPRPSR